MDYPNRHTSEPLTLGARGRATILLAGWIVLLLTAIVVLTGGAMTPPTDTGGTRLIGWVTSQPLDAGVLALRLGVTLACVYLLVLCLATMASERWSGRPAPDARHLPRRRFATALHSPRIARWTRQASGVGLVATLTITGAVVTSTAAAADDDTLPVPVDAPPGDRDDVSGAPATSGSAPAVMVMLPADADNPEVATMVMLPASVGVAAESDPQPTPAASPEPSGDDGGTAVMVVVPAGQQTTPEPDAAPAPDPAAEPAASTTPTGAARVNDETSSPQVPTPSADSVPASPPTASTTQPAPLDPVVSEAETEIWVIEPGDHLWAIAREYLEDNTGAAATDAEVNEYWVRLIGANEDRLADPSNPDLVFVGQELQLPALIVS